MRSKQNERGAVTAFVTVFTVALLLVAGLVIDGGFLINARRQAINEAESAARAGAQALDTDTPLRSQLNNAAARQAAAAYLTRTGHDGDIQVDGDLVTVNVTFERPMTILGLGGLASATVHGRGTARPTTGIVAEGDL